MHSTATTLHVVPIDGAGHAPHKGSSTRRNTHIVEGRRIKDTGVLARAVNCEYRVEGTQRGGGVGCASLGSDLS